MAHQGFVDWMKALGMLLIVTGHVVGDPYHLFNMVSQPIYSKQLGVSIFLFIAGWSLANDIRPVIRVAFNRIFPLYFYGLSCAVLLSVIFTFTKNTINASNYLPFIFGVNVIFNFFPANPTTWYIGTYLHVVLFWCFFLRGKNITLIHLLVAFIVENVARCLLIASGKEFVAYMLLPNWLTVFLLGCFLRQRRDAPWSWSVLWMILGWALIVVVWASPLNTLRFDGDFPFRDVVVSAQWALPVRSILISIMYIMNTVLIFELFRRIPKSKLASFFARNTLIIFIAHMPVVYQISDAVYGSIEWLWVGQLSLIIILYVGLGIVSELIQKVVDVKAIGNRMWNVIGGLRASSR